MSTHIEEMKSSLISLLLREHVILIPGIWVTLPLCCQGLLHYVAFISLIGAVFSFRFALPEEYFVI